MFKKIRGARRWKNAETGEVRYGKLFEATEWGHAESNTLYNGAITTDEDESIPEFLLLYSEPLREFAKRMALGDCERLSPNASTMLFVLLAQLKLGSWNTLEFTQKGLAEQMGWSTDKVKRSLRELKKLELLTSHPHKVYRNCRVYKFNPLFIWKGKTSDRDKALLSSSRKRP